ncbi:hypothetical protein O6H91_05G118400 [Diphasiastrum complanatum]|uniref:Uncharacterized protein n=1 Tax=Diphasiastrum complanatum TaxID=34168 RepID=A0ACC2DSY1_DIPCM|nr:hypothetical protein O6H91_Y432100 [Diphasiastrum complanatum]KAJ7557242.1 hypothetical protein O6H91_05G118400 [Diphasiastrum complanatum]
MRKRERENPCFVCGHYHMFEAGEVCETCGHRLQEATEKGPQQSAFSTEILPSFLYLGSYDNASRAELLKAQGITCILNTVPTCQNLYKNSFTYYCLKEDKILPFDECFEFIEKSRKDNARVLVHCMSGRNRSPAVVIAYLMRHKFWRLPESYQWVKDRRPSISLSTTLAQQLQQYEADIFGSSASSTPMLTSEGGVSFGFGFSNGPAQITTPTFTQSTTATFSFGTGSAAFGSSNFIFGALGQDQIPSGSSPSGIASKSMDQTMDSA